MKPSGGKYYINMISKYVSYYRNTFLFIIHINIWKVSLRPIDD